MVSISVAARGPGLAWDARQACSGFCGCRLSHLDGSKSGSLAGSMGLIN